MTESGKEELHQKLESKIENMLDKLIEDDEEFEDNGDQSSLKFSDDISSEDGNDCNKNEENDPFEKEIFNTKFFQNEDNSQKKLPNLNSSLKNKQNIQSCQKNVNRNFPSHLDLINNNNYSNPFSFNYIYPNPNKMNFQNNNSNPIFLEWQIIKIVVIINLILIK